MVYLDSFFEPAGKKGRPARDDVDIMRCQVWVGELKRRHPSSWREFERLVSRRLGEPVNKNYTSRWNKYARGATTPGLGESAKKITTVVESFTPGTEKIYWHPFWDALKDAPEMSRLDLFVYYTMLPTRLCQAIFLDKPGSVFWRRPPDAINWYRLQTEGELIDRLGAALLLAQDSVLSQDPNLYHYALDLVEVLSAEAPRYPLFERHWPGIVFRLGISTT